MVHSVGLVCASFSGGPSNDCARIAFAKERKRRVMLQTKTAAVSAKRIFQLDGISRRLLPVCARNLDFLLRKLRFVFAINKSSCRSKRMLQKN